MLPTLILAGAALLTAACAEPAAGPGNAADHGSGHHQSSTTSNSAPATPAKPAQQLTVEQLAAALGCQATIEITGKDYRQGSCTAAGTKYVLLDFATATGQRGWLDAAEMYGGVYLVGERWVLSGKSKEHMTSLSATLGGTVESREH